MKKKLLPVVLVVVVIALVSMKSWIYVVEEGKQVVITQFGRPVAAVEGTLTLPELRHRPSFAVRVVGDSMDAPGFPRFAAGDLVVFATDCRASHGDCAFVRYSGDQTTFSRVFYDEDSGARLQALRPEIPPVLFPLEELQSAWPLVAHVQMFTEQGD